MSTSEEYEAVELTFDDIREGMRVRSQFEYRGMDTTLEGVAFLKDNGRWLTNVGGVLVNSREDPLIEHLKPKLRSAPGTLLVVIGINGHELYSPELAIVSSGGGIAKVNGLKWRPETYLLEPREVTDFKLIDKAKLVESTLKEAS